MINLKNDYNQIAHRSILEKMLELQDETNTGYGLDKHSEFAKELIKKKINNYDVDIHFLVGGTITNKTVIDHMLRPYEAIIACDTGHISVHETGAIESVRHKVITVKNQDGKIRAKDIEDILTTHIDEHMVLPKAVYISDSTELGSVYKKEELKELYSLCKKHNLYLYIDGARLAIALTSEDNDLDFQDLPNLCDVFYIGGTKNGAMLGEAVVIVNEELKSNFRFSIKQNGGLYSKGFVAGIQFEALFTDDLLFKLASYTNECAKLLKQGLMELNLKLAYPSTTNLIFVELESKIIPQLRLFADFEIWEESNDKTIIRLVTSFGTKKEEISEFLQKLANILPK